MKHIDSNKGSTQMLTILGILTCCTAAWLINSQLFKYTWVSFQLFLLWIAADFITGIIHWWEDSYGNPSWPIIGKYIIQPNLLHHKHPTKLLEGSYWHRIDTSVFAAALLGTFFWSIGLHRWQILVCLLFCVQGNEIHAMSHRPDRANGKFVLLLQKIGFFQSKKTHRWHHKAPYETNYCVMSDFVNPCLNKVEFWKKLEWLILKLFKIDVLRTSPIRQGY